MSARSARMVIKSTTAHIFHVGDCRIYRARRQVAGAAHRGSSGHRLVGADLSRPRARASTRSSRSTIRRFQIETGDVFVLATDGVYEHVGARFIAETIAQIMRTISTTRRGRSSRRPAGAAARTTSRSRSCGSTRCRTARPSEIFSQAVRAAAAAAAGAAHDLRRLPDRQGNPRQQPQPHLSRRRHRDRGRLVAIKIPSIDLRDDPAYLKRFLMEEWVARRIDSPHVLKPLPQSRRRNYLYVVDRICRGPDARAMDDRQSEARPRDGARHRRADRQGPARLPPQGDAASGPAARQHHDRQDRNGEDHRLRRDRGGRASPKPRRPRPTTTSWARRNTPRRNIFSAKAARRAPTCFRSA